MLFSIPWLVSMVTMIPYDLNLSRCNVNNNFARNQRKNGTRLFFFFFFILISARKNKKVKKKYKRERVGI